VIVFGISFGGGLALRAACEPESRGAIERVIALGAHHDAARVSRFFLGEAALGPSGEPAQVEPHQYGRTAIWMSLFGTKHNAPFSDEERSRALAQVAAQQSELDSASPSRCPEPISVPLFLVHGTGDRVVPYTETRWNAQQFARQTSVRLLVSPAIVHAEYDPPSWWERLELVEFIVGALF
jgi:pimeloyl-ACP methyl ester carboxylesterase